MLRLFLLLLLLVFGCSDTPDEILKEVRKTGTITDEQALILGRAKQSLKLHDLTSLTDEQAVHLSSVRHLRLSGLASINEKQAASLSRVKSLYVSDAIRSQIRQTRIR